MRLDVDLVVQVQRPVALAEREVPVTSAISSNCPYLCLVQIAGGITNVFSWEIQAGSRMFNEERSVSTDKKPSLLDSDSVLAIEGRRTIRARWNQWRRS
jgi:hypothetical protein